MKRIACSILIAAVLWFLMFSPLTAHWFNFWLAMSCSAVVLLLLSLPTTRTLLKNLSQQSRRQIGKTVLLAVTIAAGLWLVFYTGDYISRLLFDFARPQVDTIYTLKNNTPHWLITLLLLFLIGPAEEFFWRVHIQQKISQRYNPNIGFFLTTAVYTLVHLPAANFMLIMAAMVCGICWGLLYKLRPQWVGAIILSHVLWDVAVFVVFPI